MQYFKVNYHIGNLNTSTMEGSPSMEGFYINKIFNDM